MLLDMRSVDMRCFSDLERKALAIVERRAKDGDGQTKLELGGTACWVTPTNHPPVQTCTAIYQAWDQDLQQRRRHGGKRAALDGLPRRGPLRHVGGERASVDELIETASLATEIKSLLLTRLAVTRTR